MFYAVISQTKGREMEASLKSKMANAVFDLILKGTALPGYTDSVVCAFRDSLSSVDRRDDDVFSCDNIHRLFGKRYFGMLLSNSIEVS